jgi:hypothetical protein
MPLSDAQITDMLNGRRLTLAEAEEWLANARGLTREEERASEKAVNSYRTREKIRLAEVYREARESHRATAVAWAVAASTASTDAQKLLDRAARGLITAAELRAGLAKIRREFDSLRDDVEELSTAEREEHKAAIEAVADPAGA